MFTTNDNGLLRYKFVNGELIKTITVEPLLYTFITILAYFAVGTKSYLFFYFGLGFIIIGYIVLGLYATLRMARRQNRTISEISFENDNIVIKTDKVAWIRAKEFRFNKSELNINQRKFEWYTKNALREGISINVDDTELYLVKYYFDNYDEIVKMLS